MNEARSSSEPRVTVWTGGAPRRFPVKTFALLGLSAIALPIGWFVVSNALAKSRLDALQRALQADVAATRAADAAPRPALVGEATPGNAVLEYRGLEWAFRHSKGQPVRGLWAVKRPALPPHAAAVAAALAGFTWDLSLAQELSMHAAGGPPPGQAALAQFEAFRPLTRFVRAGVTRTTCDWEPELERGVGAEVPYLQAAQAAGVLLAYEAHAAPTAHEAAEAGLVLVAFGQDFARTHRRYCGTISLSLGSLGAESLARTLGRPDLTPGVCQRILTALEAAKPIDFPALLRDERRATETTLLLPTGRPLGPSAPTPRPGSARAPKAPVPSFVLDWFMDRELRGYAQFMDRFAAAANLPTQQRKAAEQAVRSDLEGSWHPIARSVIPSVVEIRDSVDRATVTWNAARVLAAAQLQRLERGTLPGSLAALEPILGTLPPDPFAPAGQPLRLVVSRDAIRCYSVGDDGADDGGQVDHGTPDVGLVCRLPEAN